MKSKLLLLLFAVSFFFQSCKKENISNPVEVAIPEKGFIEQAQIFLKSNYSASALSDLSFKGSKFYKLDKGRYVIKVPFKIMQQKTLFIYPAILQRV
jgi:hypothetical protein